MASRHAHTGGSAHELVSKGRVEALSDGIFAIVVTLLVLEIKVPHLAGEPSNRAVLDALVELAPKVVSWVISFAVLFVIYLNHHRLFQQLEVVDRGLFWLNANLLLWASLIPFPTALMGEYPSNAVAVSTYGMVMALMALGFVLMRLYLLRHRHLLDDTVDTAAFRRATVTSLMAGPLANGVGAALAWVSEPLAIACYAAVPLYFMLPRWAAPPPRDV